MKKFCETSQFKLLTSTPPRQPQAFVVVLAPRVQAFDCLKFLIFGTIYYSQIQLLDLSYLISLYAAVFTMNFLPPV